MILEGSDGMLRGHQCYLQTEYDLKISKLLSVAPTVVHFHIRRWKKGCPNIGPVWQPHGTLAFDYNYQQISEIFENTFCAVYVADAPGNPHANQESNVILGNI